MTFTSKKLSDTSDSGLLIHLKQELDAAADGLDMATQSRLNQARQRVLATQQRRVFPPRLLWIPGMALASFILMVSSLAPSRLTSTTPMLNSANLLNPLPLIETPEWEILMASEELELLDQLDFYESLVDMIQEPKMVGGAS